MGDSDDEPTQLPTGITIALPVRRTRGRASTIDDVHLIRDSRSEYRNSDTRPRLHPRTSPVGPADPALPVHFDLVRQVPH